MSADSILRYYDKLADATRIVQNGAAEFSKDSGNQIEFRPHMHQVAGHRVENGKAEFAMLHGRSGRVLKPLQDHDRGQTELRFYRTVSENVNHSRLRSFVPQFHAVRQQNGIYYLELTDLTHEFNEPCIVDIKIGALLYGPEKMAIDLERIEKKYPLARHLGYQILGMKTYCPSVRDYRFHDKIYFRQELHLDNVVAAGLGLFFQCCGIVRREIIAAILNKLDDMLAWFLEQKSFVFYGSSLLIMYEGGTRHSCPIHGAAHRQLSEANVKVNIPQVDVKMIDFAHVFPSESRDENYIDGLRSLRSHFQLLMEDEISIITGDS